jgi:hypothetical protein
MLQYRKRTIPTNTRAEHRNFTGTLGATTSLRSKRERRRRRKEEQQGDDEEGVGGGLKSRSREERRPQI